MFSRLVGKETGYESRDSRLRQTFRILSALVPVLLPRRVGDGHAGLLKSGEHLGLREGRRLRREVDVCVRIKSGTATSSSPSSTATWSGHAKMWSGPIVEGDHLVVGVVGALLGEHLHLLHVGWSLPCQAGGALRGGTAEPVSRWGYKSILNILSYNVMVHKKLTLHFYVCHLYIPGYCCWIIALAFAISA